MDATGAIDRLEIEAGGLTFTGRACGPRAGRRVLLLHGFPQTSWAWRDELWALGGAGYRAVAPDLRGYCCGARPAAMADYATERLLGDVLALADSMEMGTFDLVGHDWGGLLAWIVASRHPERVRSLSVVSTPHPLALQRSLLGGDPAQVSYGAGMDAFREPEVPERLLLGADGSGRGLATLLAETGLDDEDANMYVLALTEPGALTAALNWYRAMDSTATHRPRAGGGPDPVCLVHGGRGLRVDRGPGHRRVRQRTVPIRGPRERVPLDPGDGAGRALRPFDPPSRGALTRCDQGERQSVAACENGGVSASAFALTDVQREFRDTLRTFCEEKVAPNAAEVDRNAEFPWKSFEACKEMELPALGIPEDYGGAGADTVTQAIAVEELSRVCASTSLTILISKLGMLPVMNWGSEELKRAYVPRVATGRSRPAIASPRRTPGATWPPCAPEPCVTATTTS